ncbi:MAG: 4-hydroxybenzoate octaprenyltransferase [Pseudomonadota bacterium]
MSETDTNREIPIVEVEGPSPDTKPADADTAASVLIDLAPPFARPYLILSRVDRPTGFWLLAIPCWIGLAFSRIGDGFALIDPFWIFLFGIGAIAMRGAGCTWNDLTDRRLDAQVARTAARPLPAGQVSTTQAYIWLAAQLVVGFGVWLILPNDAKVVALLSIPLVAAYPYMKRITWWPQAWLGVTFNWGVLVAYFTAGGESLPGFVLVLVLLGGLMLWTIAYDTIYALQDVEDDALAGIKSTARLFGNQAAQGALICHLGAAVLIALSAWVAGAGRVGALTALVFLGHGLYQSSRLRASRNTKALEVFRSNVWAGAIVAIGFAIAVFLS